MTIFIRAMSEADKASALAAECKKIRCNEQTSNSFQVTAETFRLLPGSPFAYWITSNALRVFQDLEPLEGARYTVKHGSSTSDDFRFLRIFWETEKSAGKWIVIAKGGKFSPFYADFPLVIGWEDEGRELKSFEASIIRNPSHHLRPGLTWPRRTSSGLSLRVLPKECICADKGPSIFAADNNPQLLLALLAIGASQTFQYCVEAQLAAADAAARSYEIGVLQRTPFPSLSSANEIFLAKLAHQIWSLKRTLDTVDETSHAFLLPTALRMRLGEYNPTVIEAEISRSQAKIDASAFELYGFSDADCVAMSRKIQADVPGEVGGREDDEDFNELPADNQSELLSWAVGVAFGRFDWRLASGERQTAPEHEPFDPLPTKSPGMLPDGTEPFHAHAGILVDDQGHPHGLAHLVEEVLGRVDMPVPDDVRRWIQRDFFAFHLQRYSKSRRKAPIYWPLSTTSGSYTLWLYYPSLTSQTLYTAINDFVEPKLKEVGAGGTALRNKGAARTRDDEKAFEALQAFELELIELRDTLLNIAQHFQPNHDDGVQITAAPLWPLFRHKPWQKILKDTWAKLEKGDYDWAHLAMAYWPDRVREKCKTDKSLAIAHGLEDLYVEPEAGYRATLQASNPSTALHFLASIPSPSSGFPILLPWSPLWPQALDANRRILALLHDDDLSSQSNSFEAKIVASLTWCLRNTVSAELDGRGTVTHIPPTPQQFWGDCIGIVTPHRAQRALVVRELRAIFPTDPPDLIDSAVDTVEKFQGGQRHTIIVTFGVGDADVIMGEEAFLMQFERTNVAISRAMAKCIVIMPMTLAGHVPHDKKALETAHAIKDYVDEFCNREIVDQVTLGATSKQAKLRYH